MCPVEGQSLNCEHGNVFFHMKGYTRPTEWDFFEALQSIKMSGKQRLLWVLPFVLYLYDPAASTACEINNRQSQC